MPYGNETYNQRSGERYEGGFDTSGSKNRSGIPTYMLDVLEKPHLNAQDEATIVEETVKYRSEFAEAFLKLPHFKERVEEEYGSCSPKDFWKMERIYLAFASMPPVNGNGSVNGYAATTMAQALAKSGIPQRLKKEKAEAAERISDAYSRYASNRNRLMEGHLKFAIVKAYRWANGASRAIGRSDSFEDDLLQEAQLGFSEAAIRFDPAEGVKFLTYAGHYVNKRIRLFLRDERHKGFTGMTHEEGKPFEALSLDYRREGEDGDERPLPFEMQLTDGSMSTDSLDVKIKMRALMDSGLFSDRERAILYMSHGLEGSEMTLSEVGAELGVSRERIRQVSDKAVRKLRLAWNVGLN